YHHIFRSSIIFFPSLTPQPPCSTLFPYTTLFRSDQQVIDAYHSDPRLARAAGRSIIPVDTRLARGIERILPKFAGRFEAIQVRVPTTNVTAMDLSVTVNTPVTVEQINETLAAAARGSLAEVLGFVDEPLVSIDFNHDPRS